MHLFNIIHVTFMKRIIILLARQHGGESLSWSDPLLLDSTGRDLNPSKVFSFKLVYFLCHFAQITLQTPALKAEGTLGGPKITKVTGNTVGVLRVNVVRDSLVSFRVELFLS